jgi:hypothetical protein
MPNLNMVVRGHRWSLLPALAAVAVLSGCLKNEADDFPAGLLPIDTDNLAEFPTGCQEAMGFIPKARSLDGYWIGNGKGYIHASLDDVYRAMQDWQLGAERTSESVTQPPNQIASQDPHSNDYPIDFTVHHLNEVTLLKLNVEFDITWRYGYLGGSLDNLDDSGDAKKPTSIIGSRHKKTNGTTHIQVMEGSILAYPATDPTCIALGTPVTAIEIIRHLQNDDPGGQAKVAMNAACWTAYYYYSLLYRVNNPSGSMPDDPRPPHTCDSL